MHILLHSYIQTCCCSDSAGSVCSAELSEKLKTRMQVVQNNVISYAEWTHRVTD